MPELQLLRLDHAAALLAFELENRAYFAASIPDRGDDYFTHFATRHRDLVADQGVRDYFHVLVGDNGEILGRFNLVDVTDGSAELGFRVAQAVAGKGVATAAVRSLLALAPGYGLTALRAAATEDNLASQAVLTRAGFTPVGAVLLDGRPGITFALDL